MLSRLRTHWRLTRARVRSRLRSLGLGRHARAILTETENGRLLVDPSDAAVGWQLDHHGVYEREELEFLSSKIDGTSRVCIVGAHVGAMAVPLAGKCCSLIAFEANPATYELLSLNIVLNDLANVEIRCTALGEKDGEIEFLVGKVNSGGSKRRPLKEIGAFTFDRPGMIKIPMTTLRQALPEGTWDLMLMDIEGSEYFALQGAGERLADIRQLHIEYDPNHLKYVAGIGNAEFLGLLAPHYSKVTVAPGGGTMQIEEVAAQLDEFWKTGQAVNLLFAK